MRTAISFPLVRPVRTSSTLLTPSSAFFYADVAVTGAVVVCAVYSKPCFDVAAFAGSSALLFLFASSTFAVPGVLPSVIVEIAGLAPFRAPGYAGLGNLRVLASLVRGMRTSSKALTPRAILGAVDMALACATKCLPAARSSPFWQELMDLLASVSQVGSRRQRRANADSGPETGR